MKLHIINSLNDQNIIEFCIGEKEYTLKPEEEITVDVNDEDVVYFDTVYQEEECEN